MVNLNEMGRKAVDVVVANSLPDNMLSGKYAANLDLPPENWSHRALTQSVKSRRADLKGRAYGVTEEGRVQIGK